MIRVLSVSEFIEQINGIIAGEFIVEGEISGFTTSQNKWVYFNLKDSQSTLACFGTVFTIKVPLEDGMKVKILGYPNIYAKSGRFSLVVQRVELAGDGTLRRAYELLKDKLSNEGVFSEERKRPLPYLPSKIGVITSKDSAAFGDFIRIISNRWGGAEIILKNTAVQGIQAIDEIVNAFKCFDSLMDVSRPEVLVLIRGGGSLEDLAAFNSEEVVRAIYNSRIPVLAGIGHERDVTLAELAADRRASTPSNAAEIIVPAKGDFISSLDFDLQNIESCLRQLINKKTQALDQAFYVISSNAEKPLVNCKNLLDRFGGLRSMLISRFNAKKESVCFAERMLKNFNPKQVLKKGYSITKDINGHIIKSSKEVGIGDEVVIELNEGTLKNTVMSK